MPADRTKRSSRAGPSTTKPKAKKYALPPIAGAGDEADVHAARSRAVAVGAVADLDDEEDDDGEDEDEEGMEMEDGEGEGEGNDDPTELGEEDGGAKRKEKGKGKAAVKGKKRKSPGIVYISRLPPGMTPHKVRHLMAKWGEVGRVYAQHRDAVVGYNPDHHKKKERHKSADYNEAWVEFLDKSVAKTVASMLNAQVIGGKKGDRWRDDIWTMRYLSGFKWEMLGEQVAYERQVHQSRMRAEIQRSKTEQNAYLKNVELARVLKKRESRKAESGGDAPKEESKSGKSSGKEGENKGKRSYKQREVVDRAHGLAAKGMDDVLGSLF